MISWWVNGCQPFNAAEFAGVNLSAMLGISLERVARVNIHVVSRRFITIATDKCAVCSDTTVLTTLLMVSKQWA